MLEYSIKGLEIHKTEMRELLKATEYIGRKKPAIDDAVEAGVDLLASVVLFLGVSSDPYAPGNLVPPFNGNLDVGVDLELDSPAFFALGDEDVCPDRDIPFLCLSGSDKKSDCSHKYSSF